MFVSLLYIVSLLYTVFCRLFKNNLHIIFYCSQNWARRYYDLSTHMHIETNIEEAEVRQMLVVQGLDDIPIVIEPVRNVTYKQSIPKIGDQLSVDLRSALCAGCFDCAGFSTQWLLTVAHLFNGNEQMLVLDDGSGMHFQLELRHNFRFYNIDIAPQHVMAAAQLDNWDTITADVAFIKANNIQFSNTLSFQQHEYHPVLWKGQIYEKCEVLLQTHNGELKTGYIRSKYYTDRENGLYNVLTFCDVDSRKPTAMTAEGDSGTLVVSQQTLSDGPERQDIAVYSMVTGFCTSEQNSESWTVGNRLWDVFQHCKDDLQITDFH